MKKIMLLAATTVLATNSAYSFTPYIDVGIGDTILPEAKIDSYHVVRGPEHLPRGVSNLQSAQSLSAQLAIGMRINRNFSVELEHTQMKELESSASTGIPISAFNPVGNSTLSTSASADAINLKLDIPMPAYQDFFITSKAGLANINIEQERIERNYYQTDQDAAKDISYKTKSSGLGVNLGIGLGYHLSEQLSVSAGFNYLGTFKNNKNIQQTAIRLNYLI